MFGLLFFGSMQGQTPLGFIDAGRTRRAISLIRPYKDVNKTYLTRGQDVDWLCR